ncbi:MAG: hypothetical protein IH597_10480 [Bacteroidales bacterium]|nr:hypothetical protein [Bacteroidales bacterium]
MNKLKNLLLIAVALFAGLACEKEIDNIDKLDNVNAPSITSVVFDIKQDNSGFVTMMPQAEGVTGYMVKFGDVAGETPTKYEMNDKITHTYAEGVYAIEIAGIGLTGLTSAYQAELNISFKAPENLVVSIQVDGVNPRIINVSATATYATVMDIYFGDTIDEVPVTVLPGEVASNHYDEPGDYEIKVVAKSGGSATTEYTQVITISAASDPVNLPIGFESFTVNYAFVDFGGNVSTVIDNPDPSGLNTSAKVAQAAKSAGAEVWAGSLLTLGNPINFSNTKLFRIKVWSPKIGAVVKLKVENLNDGNIAHEVDATTTVSNEWEELQFDFSAIDVSQEYQKIVFFFDFGNVGDGSTYYFDDVRLTAAVPGTGITGTWKMAPEAGSMGVGPNQGDISWWAIDDAGVSERACYFDDLYVFAANGTFSNVLGAETWVEDWQGVTPQGCHAPVAPHDGSVAATYVYNAAAETITLNGKGAYLGLPKVFNGGELTNPNDAPESITYIVDLSDDGSTMILDISIGGGWWRFKLIKEDGGIITPLTGTWQMAAEAGSLGVGPNQGDISWWSISTAGVTERACYFDDLYVFGANGSFSNILGDQTWIEPWQGASPEGCNTPVAPHDGSTSATYVYDEAEGTVTLNGVGAYLGLPKVFNGGELTIPGDAPETITYIIELSEDNTVMIVDISIGGGWWRYKLVKN